MEYYPNTLPKFLQSSYSLKRNPSVLRTTMTNGTVRQRLLSVDAPHTLSVNLQFNNITDYQTWLNFYENSRNHRSDNCKKSADSKRADYRVFELSKSYRRMLQNQHDFRR